MTDLGAVQGTRCGYAYGINSKTQVVGSNGLCHGGVDAFLWENGSIYDLNDLVAGDAPLHLVYALYITDNGLIAGTGVPPGVSVYDVDAKGHVFLLVPCEHCEVRDTASKVVRNEWLGGAGTNSDSKQESRGSAARIRNMIERQFGRKIFQSSR